MRTSLRVEVPAFLGIVLMLLGAVFVLVVARLALASVHPDRVRIGMDRASAPPAAVSGDAAGRLPICVDVWQDRLAVEGQTVAAADLDRAGNAFSRRMSALQQRADGTYVVLMVHPGGAPVARRVKAALRSRQIGVAIDLAAPQGLRSS